MKVLKNLIHKSAFIIIMFVATVFFGKLTAMTSYWLARAIFYTGFLVSFCIMEGIIILCLELKYIGKGFIDTKAEQ